MRDRKIALLVIASFALIVLFLMLPKQPASVRTKKPMDQDSLKLAKAIQLVRSENPMEGISLLRELVQSDSTNLEAQFQLGLFSIESGQMDKAVARFEKILAIDPTHTGALVELGGIKMTAGQNEEALQLFKMALETNSENLVANFLAAQLEEKMAMWEEAKKHYEKVLEISSEAVVADTVKQRLENINKKLIP